MSHTRLVSFWSVAAYLPKGTTIEKFWPLDSDESEDLQGWEEKALSLIMQREEEYLANQKNLEQL
jgi:hypothetical protein